MSTLKRIGILGGTFDPIHNAHIACAETVLELFQLDEVRFIPCANTPHREQPLRSAEHRCEMVNLAIAGKKQFVLDKRECERDGLSYTVDTLLSLKEELGNDCVLFFIMGIDAFQGFLSWKTPEKVLELCHFIVIDRPKHHHDFSKELSALVNQHVCEEKQQLDKNASGCIYFIEGPMLDISATTIRQTFDLTSKNAVESIRALSQQLPDSVKHYIHQHGLYQERN